MQIDKQISNAGRIEILRTVSIFSDTEDSTLEEIACALGDLCIKKGETIFLKGDPARAMFIIVKGSVIVHDGDYTFTTLKDGDSFGEFSLIELSDRTASATAIQETHLLRLDQETFYSLMANNINVTRGVLKSLINRVKNKDVLEEQLAERNAEILKQKEEIEAQRDEIEAQRDEIQKQHDIVANQRDKIMEQKKEITDSIHYASRIQSAILPPEDYLNSVLKEYFILYKPRDIVSGDFFWFKKTDDKIFLVAADCTGHGVPGAFMSMLGVSLLNEIVNNNLDSDAHIILNKLRNKVKTSLRQTGNRDKASDGMDLSFCIINRKQNTLQYAGANNPIYIIRDNVLLEMKPDKMPIGIHIKEKPTFNLQEVKIETDDVLYMFSDGYIDQFGGELGRKFLTRNFKNLLLDIHGKQMDVQELELNFTIENWMGKYSQLDDILVIGVRLSQLN